MSRTRPTTEQVRFRSAATGEHILDTYMEAAELGGRTLSDLVQDVWQPNGIIRQDLVEWRLRNGSLQTRVGDYADPNAGWRDVSKFFSHRGNFAAGTLYENYETVTVADGSLHVVNNLTVPTSYASEAAFKLAHTRLINTQVLDNYIIQAEAAQTAAQTARTNAETARTQAQAAQAAAEAARNLSQTYRNEAQTHRTNAELAMAGANTARDAAQTARTGAETAQGLAETARNAAQTAQGAAVTARTGAETARAGAEGARDTAIAARDTTTQARDEVNGLLGDVVSTSTAQSITGLKTFAGGLQVGNGNLDIRTASGVNKHVWFRDADGTNKAIIYHEATNDKLNLAKYAPASNSAHVARLEIMNTGAIHAAAGFFSGPASGLTGMNATELTTGTVPDARLPATAVKTTGDQTIGGVKTFSGAQVKIPSSSGAQAEPSLEFSPGNGISANSGTQVLALVAGGVRRLTLDATNGRVNFGWPLYGDGTGLSALNASQLTAGTVPNARMSGDYSWGGLTLTGNFSKTGSNTWGTGFKIEGTTPNIRFDQTDATNGAIVGVNGTQFYVLSDNNGDGTHENITFSLDLVGSIAYVGGREILTDQATVRVGNGLTGAGNMNTPGASSSSGAVALGTPSSITADSTNSVTASSHTHYIDRIAVLELISRATAGENGTYALLTYPGNTTIRTAGFTIAGSSLQYANADGGGQNSPAGTWRLVGVIGTATSAQRTSLWFRIS